MWGDARMAARRLAWERLARSLLSCVSSSHRSNSVGRVSRPAIQLASLQRTMAEVTRPAIQFASLQRTMAEAMRCLPSRSPR